MKIFLVAYLTTALAFLGCDIVWLNLAAKRLYRPELGDLLLPNYKPAPAIAFYLIYIVGIVTFALLPGLDGARWTAATWRGALFGLIAYATYDLTNQATLRNWSMTVTIADLCWGSFATAVAATIGCIATRAIAKI